MSVHQSPSSRFHYEFWLVAAIVGLGFFQSVTIGFYRFRVSDVTLILSLVYGLVWIVGGRFEARIQLLLILFLTTLFVRVLLEFGKGDEVDLVRTLFGMTATYLAPIVFFVTRQSRVGARTLVLLMLVSCFIALYSQLGFTGIGEGYVSGLIDLSKILGRQISEWDRGYQENTIAIWRALSAGVVFALVLCKTGFFLKIIGTIGLFIELGGGGGGRSALLFAFSLPLVLFALQGQFEWRKRVRRIVVAGIIGALFAAFYLWAPVSGQGAVKGKFEKSHTERVLEVLIVFTGDWQVDPVTGSGGFDGRTVGYEAYARGIVSDPRVFLFGTGLSRGAAFADTPNVLAHNMILDVWGLSGIVGVVFFFIFLAYVFSDLREMLAVTPDSSAAQIISFSYAGAMIYLAQFVLFQAVTADRSFMIVFYLLAGLFRPITGVLIDLSKKERNPSLGNSGSALVNAN